MKLFGHYFYFLISRHKITKEQRWALARGISHIHGNPIRKPLIRLIHQAEKEAVEAGRTFETPEDIQIAARIQAEAANDMAV